MYSKKIGAGIVSLAMLASSFATAVPAFTASAAGVDKSTYSDLLNASVKFYDANLCGNDVSGNNFSWRKNCHTFDSQIPLDKTNINGNSSVVSVVDSDGNGKVDVEGGYHDAGDHVKFGLPAAYSASTLGWSYSEFKSAFTATGASSQMLKTLNNFNDYFVKSTYLDGSGNVVAFCYQVGDGTADHNYWGSPEAQKDTTTNEGYSGYSRTTYFATSSNPATDIVSNTAASLAASYVNTSNAEHLKYAKALYSFAKNNSKQTAKEGASEFYNSDTYLDDMAWAAVWLYKATNDSSYLADANSYISEAGYAATSPNWMHCWNNVWNGVLVMMAELDTANSSTYWGYVSKELDHFKNDLTKTGIYSVQDNWGSARYNAMAQMIACIYDRANNSSTYSSWAETQMDYLLGNNSNNLCYVASFNSKSVKQPHHRAAQGQSTAEASGYSHELTGALVGGPKSDGSYKDKTVEYEYTEVALDYNAGLVGAAAGLYSISSGLKEDDNPTTTTTSTTTTTPRNTNTSTSTSTTTTPATSSTLKQTVSVNSTIKASEWSDKNNHFVIKMADLGIQKGDVITKVTYELSSSTKLGDCTFAYAMGVTNDCPAKTDDWWYQGDSFNKTFTGNSATLTWNVPSNIGSYANPDSDIHLGAYYFNPDAQGNRSGSITLKNVTVEFTRAGSSGGTTTTTTTPRVTTTTTPKNTSTTTSPSGNKQKQTVTVNSTIKASEWSDKNNHFVIKMADFGIQKGDVITKVTYELSSSTKLGDCTFAYAMGVTNDCPAKTDDWWYQGDSFNKTFTGNSATLTWNVPSNIGSYANPDSDIHLGAYYFNPDAQGNRSGSITLKNVTVEFTRAGSSSGTTTTTTTPRVTTTTTPRVTTTTTPKNTSTTTSPSGNKQKQTVTVNSTIKASEWSDKNNHFVIKMADFGIQKGDVITKVTYELSSSTKLGDCTFAYAMGVTNDCPAKTDDWWYQGDSFNKTFTGNSATLTWNVPSNIGSYANPDSDIHLGAYYFNPDAQGNRSGSITLKSVTVEFTRAGSSSGTTTTTTTTPRQTSSTTTTTKTPSTSGGKTASVTVNETLNAKDWSDENNLFSVKTADFGIQRGDIIRSVTFEISSSTKLGNCTFAYGMGVTNDCTAKTDDWWYQGEGIDFVFSGSTATLVWNVDEKIGAYVNPDGEIHLGAYYFNPDAQGNRSGSITLKNVKVTFDRPSESTTTTTTTPKQTSATTTTTPKQTTVTTTTTPKQTSSTTTTTTKGGSSTGKKGDINGDGKVNITDLFTLAQHIATVKTITGDALKNADVNGDNKVNIADLFKIAQVIVGLASL